MKAEVSPELSPHSQCVPDIWIIYEFIWWKRVRIQEELEWFSHILYIIFSNFTSWPGQECCSGVTNPRRIPSVWVAGLMSSDQPRQPAATLLPFHWQLLKWRVGCECVCTCVHVCVFALGVHTCMCVCCTEHKLTYSKVGLCNKFDLTWNLVCIVYYIVLNLSVRTVHTMINH